MIITYDILIKFGEKYVSDYPQIEINVESISDLNVNDHGQVCVMLLNHYCNIYKQMGELIRFGYEGEDLTEEIKSMLIQHK